MVVVLRLVKLWMTPLAALLLLLLMPPQATAHDPSDMHLRYDLQSQTLDVTITHSVPDPNAHYIRRVEITKNGLPSFLEDYTSQPTTSTFTYSYVFGAIEGDVLSVTAHCSISGSISRQITVVESVLDGTISEGEYEFSASLADGDYVVHWRVEGSEVVFGIVAETEGWIALGIDPEDRMQGADILIGWVSGGTPQFLDTFATGPNGPHPPDTSLGGTHDVVQFNGSEQGGATTIEFRRLLVTGDTFDKDIPAEGRFDIIWALGPSDAFDEKHVRRGYAALNLGTGWSGSDSTIELLPIHVALMGTGFTLIVAGMLIARFARTKRWWLKVHRSSNVIGALLVVVGIVAAFLMISATGGSHFRVGHAYVGIVGGVLALSNAGIGMSTIRFGRKRLRPVHRWLGRATLIVLLVNMFLGVSLAGYV